MNERMIVCIFTATFVLGSALSVSAQGPSAGDMQQRLEQEMATTKRSAAESISSARQTETDKKSEAEQKMKETAEQHKRQAESKMTEEIEKAKRKAQSLGQ